MGALGQVFGWIGRKGVVFLLLLAALIGHQMLSVSSITHEDLRAKVDTLRQGSVTLATFSRRNNAAIDNAYGQTRGQLIDRIATARRERDGLAGSCAADVTALLTKGAEGVIDNRKRCIRAALLTREVDALTALERTIDARRLGEKLPNAVRRHTATMRGASAENARARGAVRRIDASWFAQMRYAEQRRVEINKAADAKASYLAAQNSAKALIGTQTALDVARAREAASVAAARSAYDRLLTDQAKALGGSGVERARGFAERVGLVAKLQTAALLLLGIIASPYLVRLFCYFVLAPAAARRAAIRLAVPGGVGAAIPPAARSTTSVAVQLAPGEELLVRQDYLQTSSVAGDKATQWLLDRRHPFSSWASGLFFLTRIRGKGEVTTVSAVRDPFAEVTVLALPEGAACVLHPRGIAAVAQPIGRPMRIRSKWRLTSLQAWLTLQLRFFVFHGPARLVIKGGRGVRVEPATRGRVFGQDQLVGFSADLAYTVTRTETFWPYLFGRESLLKDRVTDGDGVLIVEEAPFTSRDGKPRRGLEGAIDAGLKAFGL